MHQRTEIWFEIIIISYQKELEERTSNYEFSIFYFLIPDLMIWSNDDMTYDMILLIWSM